MKQVIEDILNNTILPEYEDLICGFEIKEPHERFDAKGDTPFKFISVTVTFIVGYGTKYGIPLSVRDKFDDIMNDIWDVIYNYTNIATDVYHKTVTNCGKKEITESHKVNKDEYVELYRDKDFILTIPLTHDASKKYGSDTKWCTTKKDCNKDFKKHTELGVLGYIVVRDKELKERLGSNAFALYRLKGDDFTRTIAFDDQNNEYRNGESWLGNKFDRVEKLFQFYKMMNKYNDYFEKQDTKDTIEESKEISKKDLSEDMKYNKVNTVLNRIMGSKYDWWKGIEIDDVQASQTYFIIRLKGVLKVDEEWGEKQWNTYMLDMEFPGNSGWEDNEEYELVTLGDVIGSDTSNEISDEIIDVLIFTGTIDPEIQPSFLSFRSIMLKFV